VREQKLFSGDVLALYTEGVTKPVTIGEKNLVSGSD